jgi:hypothetical protein
LADVSYLLLALIIVFDFVVSLWNAYASGVIWGLLRNQPGRIFEKACAISGLGLAFAGVAYSTTIVLAWVALDVQYIGAWDFLYLVSFDFLVFGAMIIGFGVLVTVQSIVIAYRQRSFGSIAISVWNTFAEIWDIAIYARGFQAAASAVKGNRSGRGAVVALLVVAVAIACIITYFAFRAGLRKSEGAIADSPTQAAGERIAAEPIETTHHRHVRTALIAGVAVLVVVVAAILALPYLGPVPQVHVEVINAWAPSDVCGIGNLSITYDGFSDEAGLSDAIQLQITNFNATACTVTKVVTNTTGFSLTDVQVPFSIAQGQSAYLGLTIVLPMGAYDGPLDLIYL